MGSDFQQQANTGITRSLCIPIWCARRNNINLEILSLDVKGSLYQTKWIRYAFTYNTDLFG